MKFLKKYHKWLGIILTLFIVLFAISGIILNHRKTFSGIDVNRKYLPKEYHYTNWNNAAVSGTLNLNENNILIYGNIGIWKTDSTFKEYQDFTSGFPKGVDNKKISKLYKTSRDELYAGSYFGLYKFSYKRNEWEKVTIPVKNKRITDITEKDDELYVMTRSYLLKSADHKNFDVLTLPKPENYQNNEGLFKTLWVIHSGEIYGSFGKLLVDFIALVLVFLSITGVILFINRKRIKKRVKKNKSISKLAKSNRWNLKWHNKIGWITTLFIIITTLTGMFLRPPLLIPIANKEVKKIPYTKLDDPNPWHDKLRRILYDDDLERFVLATSEGFYYTNKNLTDQLTKYPFQPPASVMGVNVFYKESYETYVVGSFEGLFYWNPRTGLIFDKIDKQPYIQSQRTGPPIGKYLVTGMSRDFPGDEIYFTYNAGAISEYSNKSFPEMPKIVEDQPISLWNLALEIHTGRIFQFLIGNFYILIVPLTGLFTLFISVSGFIVWFKRYRKKNKTVDKKRKGKILIPVKIKNYKL